MRRDRPQDRAGAAITSTGRGWGKEPWRKEEGERAQMNTHHAPHHPGGRLALPLAGCAGPLSTTRHRPASGPLLLLVPLPHTCSLPAFRDPQVVIAERAL